MVWKEKQESGILNKVLKVWKEGSRSESELIFKIKMKLFEEYKLVKSGCYILFVNGDDLYEG